MQPSLEAAIRQHLTVLTQQIGARPTGAPGNQRAGAYLRDQFMKAGWAVETPTFNCQTWLGGTAKLTCDDSEFAVQANPYSPVFEGSGRLVVCRDLASLEAHPALSSQFVALTGDLAQYPYMPKHFPFFSIDEQQQVLALLERARPAAIIAVSPTPLFCDADFPIPSVSLHPDDEAGLLACADRELTLSIDSRTVASSGYNVIARAGTGDKRIIVSAHYDTWFDTPGALDNAGGVSALLALAACLGNPPRRVELVAFNGEDHYAAPGQVLYMQQDLSDVELVINLDGIAAANKQNSIAYFIEDAGLLQRAQSVKQSFPNLIEVEPWYQSDHAIFAQRGIPAIALCSTEAAELSLTLTHTAADTLEQVDAAKITEAVSFIAGLVAS